MMDRTLSSIRAYNNNFSQSPRICKGCGQPATKDALFDVGNGIAVIERYCDQCARSVENNNRSL
jgi:predicted amidophosphoribosyltransferase